MAWKPGNSKNLELGEIPHKKAVTEEEINTLREFGPEAEKHAAMAKLHQSQEQVRDEILAMDAGKEIIDAIADFYKSLPEDTELTVFSHDFEDVLDEYLTNTNSDLDLDEVIEIVYKTQLRPEDFYFNIDKDPMMGYFVTISSCELWDNEGIIDDRSRADYIIPDWLERVQESDYDFDPVTHTPASVRRELIKLGFKENPDMHL